MSALSETIILGCAGMGVTLPPGAVERFLLYDSLLRDENQRQNLTRDLDAPDFAQRLYLDSLTPLAVEGLVPPNPRAADVGSGAGFPGIPLAIARADITFTLIDSLSKRMAFLRRVVDELGLNATVVHSRAEDFARTPAHRGGYDIVFSRAVASMPVLLELTVPLLKRGGKLIAHKGPSVVDEYPASHRAASILGAALDEPLPASAPGYDNEHVLVVARAVRRCPDLYPRKAGVPGREPLGLPII